MRLAYELPLDVHELAPDTWSTGGTPPHRPRGHGHTRTLADGTRLTLVPTLDGLAVWAERDGSTLVLVPAGPRPGAGIAPGERERVTEPFERLDPSRRRGTGGVGLGLYLSRAIAEAHGGELRVGDALGGGTRVEVRLPLPPGD